MNQQVSSISVSAQDVMEHLKRSLQVPTLVRAIARQRLIAQTAQQMELVTTPEELQESADQLRAQQELWGEKETLAWLATQALSLEDLEAMAKSAVLTQKLAQKLFSQQVGPHFLAHKKDYTQTIFCEVVLEDGDLALELYYALEEGEISFGEVAAAYATDQEMKYKGGYRGKMRCRDLPMAIATAVFAFEGQGLLKPIAVGPDYHLVWVVEKINPRLGRQLKREILFELFEGWVNCQLEKVSIDFSMLV